MNITQKLFSSLSSPFKGITLPQSVAKLADDRVPVRLEVENSESSFYTVISVRPKGVVLGRPTDLEDGILHKNGHVRFTLPDGSGKVVRMRIIQPNVSRKRGDAVILCAMPQEFAEDSKRKAERYNTTRYKNLILDVPQVEERFRIIDVSRTGCKAIAKAEREWEDLKLGVPMRFAKIDVGGKTAIKLGYLTPRVVNSPVVSFEWDIVDEQSARYLEHFVNSLRAAEVGRLKVSEKNSAQKIAAAKK